MNRRQSIAVLTGGVLAASITAGEAKAWSWSGDISAGDDHSGPQGSYYYVDDHATGGGPYLLGFCSTLEGRCSWTSATANGDSYQGSDPYLAYNGWAVPYAVNQSSGTQHHAMSTP
jgi:hypothetical protein